MHNAGKPLGLIAALVLGVFVSGLAHGADNMAREVRRGMELWDVPGMAVATVTTDTVEFSEGFGSTALDGGNAVNEHTLFAIASTTKAMVAAGLLMLADDGKLSLDDLVIDHVPELHFSAMALDQQVTIRDLLAHRTGLPSTDIWTFLMQIPLDEQIALIRNVEPAAAPRTRLIYQNTMYELAGLIIERVSGQRWDRFLTERLWHPIGMRETYGARGQIPDDAQHVLPHDELDGTIKQVDWDFDADLADAAGSAWSSAHDMSLWARFLLNDGVTDSGEQLLSDDAIAAMFEPTNLASSDDFYPTTELTTPNWRSYGLGWFQQDFQGRKIDFHTGSLSGLIALVGLDRANGRGIVVLGNRDHAEMRHALLWHSMDATPARNKRDWNQEIADLYARRDEEAAARDAETDALRLEGTRPALPIADYIGSYEHPAYGAFEVSAGDDGLELAIGATGFALQHWHLDTFSMTHDEWDWRVFIHFAIDENGRVGGLSAFGEDFARKPSAAEAE